MLSCDAVSEYAKDMKHCSMIFLAWSILLAGCGESSVEQLAKSPKVQQKLLELELRDRELAEKQKKIYDDARRTASRDETPHRESAQQPGDGPLHDASDTTPVLPSPPLDVGGSGSGQRVSAWQKLRFGLSQETVRKLLGEPVAKKRDGFLEYWYYGYGNRAGRVSFVTHSSGKSIGFGWDMPLQP